MTISDTGLQEIRSRVEAATPGPWDTGLEPRLIRGNGGRNFVTDTTGGVNEWSDAEFIAHARTDIPLLLAEIEQLREALAQSEGERDDLDTGAGMLLGENAELQAELSEARAEVDRLRATNRRLAGEMVADQ